MTRKFTLAFAMAAIGASLLVAAAFAKPASSSVPQSAGKAGKDEQRRGGTMRINVSSTDFEFVDPALTYDALGWQVLYMTGAQLLNYPDKAAPEGSQLVPEVATGLPRISRDGRTYTFTIRPGFRFSDGSPVTAANFKAAIDRAANKAQESPAIAFLHDVVGADESFAGRAGGVTGVTARGTTLTIRLKTANPTFLAELAMPFFAAIKTDMAIDSKGVNVYPSAGPYTITSRDVGRGLVVERNRFYRGTRPANPDRFVFTTNVDVNQSLLQVRRGESDYDSSGLPPTAHADLAKEFGVKKSGNGRYFVNSYINVFYLSLNTTRPTFQNPNVRKGVNYAIDRPAMVRARGAFAGKRTDQILPPNLRGFKEANLYPIRGADPARAKQVAGAGVAGAKPVILASTSPVGQAQGQIVQFNLRQMGMDPDVRPTPFATLLRTAGERGSEQDAVLIGWIADYPDPFDFINILLSGDNIQQSNNNNYAYFNSKEYNQKMVRASKLVGDARYSAYGQLDIDLMKNQAPWAPFLNANEREFVSSRVSNYVFGPVYASILPNVAVLKN